MSQIDTTVIDKLTDKPRASGIDLDTPVRAGGKAYTVAELLAAKEKLDRITEDYTSATAKATALRESVRKVLTGAASEDDARTMLTEAGFSGDDVEQYITQNYRTPPNQKGKNDSRRSSQAQDSEEDGENEPTEADLLRQELERQRSDLELIRAMRVREMLDAEIDEAVASDPYIQSLIKQRKALDKSVDEGKILEAFKARARAEARQRLLEKKKKVGNFDETWVPGEVKSAVESIVAEQKQVFGDPKFLGRSPESLAIEDELRNTKPVPPPKFDPEAYAADPGALLQQTEAFMADGLKRLAEGIPGEDTSA